MDATHAELNEMLITLTSDIVAAHVSNNSVAVDEVAGLIGNVYSALAGTAFNRALRLRFGDGATETVLGESVTGNYFEFLGLKPAVGRLLQPADIRSGSPGEVAVVSWSYWNGRFRRDPSIVGRRLYVNDTPVTIVGVAPPGFDGLYVGERTDVWLPISLQLAGRPFEEATVLRAGHAYEQATEWHTRRPPV